MPFPISLVRSEKSVVRGQESKCPGRKEGHRRKLLNSCIGGEPRGRRKTVTAGQEILVLRYEKITKTGETDKFSIQKH